MLERRKRSEWAQLQSARQRWSVGAPQLVWRTPTVMTHSDCTRPVVFGPSGKGKEESILRSTGRASGCYVCENARKDGSYFVASTQIGSPSSFCKLSTSSSREMQGKPFSRPQSPPHERLNLYSRSFTGSAPNTALSLQVSFVILDNDFEVQCVNTTKTLSKLRRVYICQSSFRSQKPDSTKLIPILHLLCD